MQKLFDTLSSIKELFLLPLAFTVTFIVAVCLHQVAHAVAARLCGIELHTISLTAWGGNPTLLEWRHEPGKQALIAAAGPAMNFILAAATSVLSPSLYDTPLLVAKVFMLVNLAIGLFNLIPAPPTDAGIILEAAVSHFTKSRSKGRYVAGLCGWIVTVISALLALYISVTDSHSLSWLNFFIPIFFYSAATRMRKSAKETEKLNSLTFFSVSDPGYLVPATSTVSQAIQTAAGRIPILANGDLLVGVVPPRAAVHPHTPAQKISLPCKTSPIDLRLDDPLISVIYAMEQLELIAVVARMPDGEPRVLTHVMASNAMNKLLFGFLQN